MVLDKTLQEGLEAATQKARELLAIIDISGLQAELTALQQQTMDPNFWNDQENATHVNQNVSLMQGKVDQIQALEQCLADIVATQELMAEIEDESLVEDLSKRVRQLVKLNRQVELETYLSGPYDKLDAVFSIHSGQGGTEAMDWASILQRMYLRYFERQNWKFDLVEESRGEEAGIKSVSYLVHGSYAYGYLKGEGGTHRLVRLSPFNADALRQTSFANVLVMPLIPENDTSIEINPDELEWQFTTSGGHGGQNVNKVATAVRLTHIPTGITVQSRQERYQIQNKETALSLLKAELAARKEAERQEELSKVKGTHSHASWGNQIRNYVLHPYHLVKDTRTGIESTDTDAVLDGDLEEFIFAEVTQL